MNEADKHTEQEGKEILLEMDRIAIQMGLLKSPEDYLIENGAPAAILDAFLESSFSALIQATAKVTGESEKVLADKEKRTPEQERILAEMSGRRALARIGKYLASDYITAHKLLEAHAKERLGDEAKPFLAIDTDAEKGLAFWEPLPVINRLVRYFFAKNKDIDPRESGGIDERKKEELIALFDRYIDFHASHAPASYDDTLVGFITLEAEGGKDASLIISTVFPQRYSYPTDKATQYFFGGETDNNEIVPLAMEDSKSKKEITTLVSISFDTLPDNVKIPKWLDLYDCAVLCAIASLYRESGAYMTTSTIYKVLTGDKEARLSKSSSKAVEDSITRLMGSTISIDASQEAAQYKLNPFTYKGNILHAEYATGVVMNGTPSTCLHVLREPVLFAYAGTKNQIASFPVAALNTPINKSREVITLQLYLLQRISAMPKISTTILYSTLFKKLNINVDSDDVAARKKQATIRNHAARILHDLQIKGFIKGYKETTRGKKFYSIEIEPAKTAEPLRIGGKSRYGRGKKSVR